MSSLFNHAVPQALRRHQLNARYIHVVTDLVTGHAAHYAADVDHLIVPTEEARAEAIKNLVPPEKITITGQPIAPDFAQRAEQGGPPLRRALGLDERMVVLLIGGGDGMGRLEVTARQIALSDLPLQLLVVCGRNQTVKENLEFLNPRLPMRVFGFVNNIPELMGASDVVVTKAGPGTICEAFAAQRPIILYDAVPGQEEGNVDYVVNNGAGAWCPTPWAVLRQLKQWLAHPEVLVDAPSGCAPGASRFGAADRPRPPSLRPAYAGSGTGRSPSGRITAVRSRTAACGSLRVYAVAHPRQSTSTRCLAREMSSLT